MLHLWTSLRAIAADTRLSEQYISQFLGQLSTLEESRFCELKYSLQNEHRGKVIYFNRGADEWAI